MASTNHIVQVLLLVALAILCKKYLQLRDSYEELKLVCGSSPLHIQDQNPQSMDGKFKRNSRLRNVASILMDSSTIDNDSENSDSTIENKEFIEINEPTFHKKLDKQDVVLTTPGLVINIAGEVSQTSNIADMKQDVITNPAQIKTTGTSDMVSTDNLAVSPSESSFLQVQITQKNSQIHESLDQDHKHQSQSSSQVEPIRKITPSITESIRSSTIDNERVFDNQIGYTDEINVNDSSNNLTDNTATDDDENKISNQHSDQSISSDSTNEEGLFVLQTSLEDIVHEEANVNAYNYFDTDESTPVLNTALHGDHLNVMTDTTDYPHDFDEGVCDHENCFEEEFYDEDQYYVENIGLSASDFKNKNKIPRRDWGANAHDFIATPDQGELRQFADQGTSAKCNGEIQTSCQFKNLCFNAKEGDFIFFKGEKSILQMDLSSKKDTNGNIFDINLSTIHRHNAAVFSVVTLPVSLLDRFSIGLVNKKVVALNRFKPDNIMHVLHDDILPLFQTLTAFNYSLADNKFNAAIAFTDHFDSGNFMEFYSSLSTVDPISLGQFNNTYDLLCFPDIHIGLDVSTVWYQYGFFEPQGAVSTLKHIDINSIRKATEFLSPNFQSNCFLCNQGNYLVFLSRKDNRLILNEGELIMSITKSTRLKVMSVSLETHSLSDIITIIRKSRGVIGMHGSLLSLAIFLPPGSIVIELFPYAVTPSHYTPFKTLCDLPGSNLIYKSWANPSKANSIPHPDRPAISGGIRHLPKHIQSEIASQSNVPQHVCCDDPSWLYHIYQDTIVDINDVITLIADALGESESKSENDVRLKTVKNDLPLSLSSKILLQDIPGSVKNLRCDKVDIHTDSSSHASFVVSWNTPWVFDYDSSASSKYKYELVIQNDNDKDNVEALQLPSHDQSYTFKFATLQGSHSKFSVWITVVGGGGDKGLTKFVRCR